MKVVKSCRTAEQVVVADRYVRLWLQRNGLTKKSAHAKALFHAVHVGLLKLRNGKPYVPLLAFFLLGCGQEIRNQKNYQDRLGRAEVFCADAIHTRELRPYCVTGYMRSCTPSSCEAEE